MSDYNQTEWERHRQALTDCIAGECDDSIFRRRAMDAVRWLDAVLPQLEAEFQVAASEAIKVPELERSVSELRASLHRVDALVAQALKEE